MKERRVGFDLLRILAIWCVLYTHSDAYFLHTQRVNAPRFWFYLCFAVAAKVAVPLFWMISGALLLEREESLSDLFRKRILRFVLVLLAASFLQYLYTIHYYRTPFSFGDFFRRFYGSEWSVSYWYLYAYIVYLLLLPFLRAVAQKIAGREYLYLFVLFAVFTGILPLIDFRFFHNAPHLNENFNMGVVLAQNLCYPLFGLWLFRWKEKKKRLGFLLPLAAAAVFVTARAGAYYCLYYNDWGTEAAEHFHENLIFLPAMALFTAALLIPSEGGGKAARWGRRLAEEAGGTVFGVMLFGNLVMDFLKRDWYWKLYGKGRIFYGSVLLVTATVLLSMPLIWLIRRIPGVKRWI